MGPNLINYAIPIFFVLIFLEILLGRLQQVKIYRLSDSISDLSSGIVSQIVGVFIRLLGLMGYSFVYEKFRLFSWNSDSWLLWIFALVGQDFFYYWAHRLSHEVNILWAAHVVHHQSEEYNLTVALRQSAFQGLFTQFVYFPLAILGIPPLHFFVAGQISLLYQFWIHTEVIGKMGWFEKIFNTPSHHRVHHAINPQYIDKNHGGTLIIWDKLFGTFAEEKEPCVYGTVTPLRSYNVVWANFHYYFDIWQLAKKADKFLDKIKVWFAMPGWVPASGGKPAYQKEVPVVSRSTFQKYDPKLSRNLAIYVVVWFVFIALMTFAYLLFWQKLSHWQVWLAGFYIIFSLLSIGAITEGKSWALLSEVLRFVVLIFVSWMYLSGQNSFWMHVVNLISVFSLLYIAQHRPEKEVLLTHHA